MKTRSKGGKKYGIEITRNAEIAALNFTALNSRDKQPGKSCFGSYIPYLFELLPNRQTFKWTIFETDASF